MPSFRLRVAGAPGCLRCFERVVVASGENCARAVKLERLRGWWLQGWVERCSRANRWCACDVAQIARRYQLGSIRGKARMVPPSAHSAQSRVLWGAVVSRGTTRPGCAPRPHRPWTGHHCTQLARLHRIISKASRLSVAGLWGSQHSSAPRRLSPIPGSRSPVSLKPMGDHQRVSS